MPASALAVLLAAVPMLAAAPVLAEAPALAAMPALAAGLKAGLAAAAMVVELLPEPCLFDKL